MSCEFKRDEKTGLWMTNSPFDRHRIVVDCLNSKIRKLDNLECNLIKDERRRKIIYDAVDDETNPVFLARKFEYMCDKEHDRFYLKANNVEYVLNHFKTWVWCEPDLYSICRFKDVAEATRDHWIANPSHFEQAITYCWENDADADLEALIVLNEVFGDEHCKIVWRNCDYSKYSALALSELIRATTDLTSLQKYSSKIIQRQNEFEKYKLREIIDKRLNA